MKKITSKILDYLKDTIPNYETKYRFFTCPVCRTVKCNIIPNTDRIFCINCRKPIGDIFDVVNILEPAKYSSKEEITQYIKTKYSIDYCTNIDINKTFDFYQSLGFDLTPIVVNSKIPLEKDWTNKEHKNKEEWLDWYSDGINFGVKSGERSKVTCLDFDTKEISEEVKKLLNPTLSTETDRGLHFVYEYETSLPTTRIDNIKLDILNNGKQFIVFPSRVNGIRRKELKGTITKMSKELLDYIKSKTTKTPTKEIFDEKIELKEVNFNLIGEGNRNNVLLHLGGILRKTLPLQQVENVLSAVNRICCNPQYPQRELKTLVESLDKYVVHDERELALKILTYLRIVGDATARDVKEVVGEGKEKTDKALAFLIKEGYAFKKRTSYHVLKKIEWKDTFVDIDKKVDFKVPYFYDSAIFRPGDMILIGGQQKIGKCISEGLILTNQGLRDISDIGRLKPEGWSKNNRHIRVFIGDKKKKAFRTTKGFYKEKVNKTIKIVTEHGYEIEGTPEHPILMLKEGINYSEKEFKNLENIQIGDKAIIVTPNIETKEKIKKGKQFNYRKSKFATNLKEIKLSSNIDKNMSKLFGYITGDGSLQHETATIYQNSKDIHNIEEIINICKKFNLPYQKRISPNKNMTKVRINSVIFSAFIRRYLFENNYNKNYNLKSVDRFIPNIIFSGKRNIQKAFIEGLYNCESWITKNKSIDISLSNEKLIKQLHVLLLNFGIIGTLRLKKGYKNRTVGRLRLSPEFCSKFLETFNLVKYKETKFLNFKNKTFHLERVGRNQYTKEPGYYLDKIVKKETINKEKYVYDFNIESKKYKINNQFWSNGFISHNSHVAMNIIKQLVEQNRRPYYLNLEAGNRFARIAKQLGMKDTDFYNATNFSPESIELEDNAITIIDWLLPKDYGETDKLFQHFAEQLFKHGGLLFVFVQLRTNGDFFAKDMVAMFPAFVCRYFYEKDKEGKENPGSGFFEVDYIREPITNRKKGQIFCKYNFETKRLIRTDELDMRMENKQTPEDIQGVSAIQQAKTGEEYKKEVENLKNSVDLPEDMVDNVTPLIIEGDE